MHIEYSIRILGGDETVTEIQSQYNLPWALTEEALARTDCDFPEVFDKIVVAPLVTQVRSYLQGRFEGYQEARAKKVIPEPPVQPQFNGGLKLPKFPDGVPVAMPAISPKPIIAKMPGSFPPPSAKIGD